MVCHHELTNNTENSSYVSERRIFDEVSNVYGYALPTVLIFGMVGNALNLAILTRRKLRKSIRSLEQSANMCLIALAVSDLNFCIFAFPSTFLPKDDTFTSKGFMLYYRLYCAAAINVFIMASTWLTVTMATERYIVICHALKQQFYLTKTRTKTMIIIVYLLSAAFNIPVIWRYEIREQHCGNETTFTTSLQNGTINDDTYRLVWAIVGNFIPLVLLLYFNVRLCYKIHKSYKYRLKFKKSQTEKNSQDSGQTLTITLVCIVIMFFILVAPSEIVMYVAKLSHTDNNFTFYTLELILNFNQAVNFSVNFVLYCIISRYYRKTLRYIMCCARYQFEYISRRMSVMQDQRNSTSIYNSSFRREISVKRQRAGLPEAKFSLVYNSSTKNKRETLYPEAKQV